MRHYITRRRSVRRAGKDQRGVALATALLLLLLLTGMSVAMMLSVNSDMLVNSYYRNFRGSFYAADSGLNIARQELQNRLLGAVKTPLSGTVQPVTDGSEGTIKSQVNTLLASYKSLIGGQPSSWPAKYQVTVDELTELSCTPTGGTGTTCATPGGATGYTYTYRYHMLSRGQAQGSQQGVLEESGTFTLVADMSPPDTTVSFAAWGMFIDDSPICSGSYLVPGTISGPVFTNGAWNFGDTGQYIFTDAVGSASAKTGFQFTSNNSCNQVAAGSYSKKIGSSTVNIAPTFQSSFKLGQPALPLPDNDFNQRRAVLDGIGTGSAPTNAEMHNVLKNVGKAAYPSNGASSGVFLPYDVDAVSGQATFTGGGIFVEGNATVTLSTTGSSGQIYTIAQNGTTTTININNAANQTVVSSGTTSLTITGVPHQLDNSGAVMNPATMLYVDGSITALSGPGQGQPAIQDGTALTITANSNVTITGDILYKTEPVTLTQNQQAPGVPPNSPADTLIPGNDKGQALGIFTAGGDIQLKNSQSNGNLQIDASLASISATGSGGLVNIGNAINKLTIVGGRIQNSIKNIGSTTRNVFFDKRYAQNGFAPPWFPSTTVTHVPGADPPYIEITHQRLQWVNQTSYQ
jgi:Tfp pilus assembly protein PilX